MSSGPSGARLEIGNDYVLQRHEELSRTERIADIRRVLER
jgi:hypothetical protein